MAGEGSIAELCGLFNVVHSGYYAWKKRGIGKRRKENAVLREEIRNILQSAKIASSMTESGNCYDNAAMESFWSTLKTEMVYRRRLESHRDARLALFHYIEVFYNRKRLHSALGYRSPEQFESRHKRISFTVPQVSIISG